MGFRSKFWTLFFLAILLGNAVPISNANENKNITLLTSEEVSLRAGEFLQDQLASAKYPVEIEINFKDKAMEIPTEDFSVGFQVMGKLKEMGRNQLVGTVLVNGERFKKFRLSAKTTAIVNVIRAKRPIKRGEIISEDVVAVEQIKTVRPLRNIVNRLEDILGTEATRNLPTGRNISFNSIKIPPLIDRGDRLLIVAQKGGMKITTPGMAQKKGSKDSVIPVINLQSKKVVYARVVDKNTVEVVF